MSHWSELDHCRTHRLTRAQSNWYPHHYRHDDDKCNIVEEEFRRSPARCGFCSLWLVRRWNVYCKFHDPTGLLPIREAFNFERGWSTFSRGHWQDDVVGHSSQISVRNGQSRGIGCISKLGRSFPSHDRSNQHGRFSTGSISSIRFHLPPSLP